MGLFSMSKKRGLPERVLYIDIHSASVRGALLRLKARKEGLPLISTLLSHRVSFSAQLNEEFHVMTDFMIKSLDEVLNTLQREEPTFIPERVVCTLTTPWCASKTHTIELNYGEERIFTKKMFTDLIEKEIDQFEQKKSTSSSDHIILLDYHLMQAKLNGYPADIPFGKNAEDVEISTLITVMHKKLHKRINESIMRVFHVPVEYHAFILAAYTAIKIQFEHQDNFVVINVSDELTEIALVHNDVLMASASFAFGRHTFLEELAKDFNKTPTQAESLIRMYQTNALEDRLVERVDASILRIQSLWLEHVKAYLNEFSRDILIPHVLYLVVDQTVQLQFLKFLRGDELKDILASSTSLSVLSLADILKNTTGKSVEDPFMTTGIHFIPSLLAGKKFLG